MNVVTRLAWRSLSHNARRSALLIAVLIVPLTIGFALSIIRSSGEFTESGRLEALIGQSEVVVRNPDLLEEVGVTRALETPPALDTGAFALVPEVVGPLSASAHGRQVAAAGYGLALDEAVHQGRFRLASGRAPRERDEVAVSRAVAERLKVGLGFGVTVGTSTAPSEVTGILDDPADTTRQVVVTMPMAAAELMAGEGRAPDHDGVTQSRLLAVLWHSAAPLALPDTLIEQGWITDTRVRAAQLIAHESEERGSGSTPYILGLIIFVIAELGLILGAVYAIVVRSAQRELALLAAVGAGPRTRRAVITGQGLISGVIATVCSFVIGFALAWALIPTVAARWHQIWQPMRVDPLSILVLVVLGVATPTVAARVAARGVRSDVVGVLRDQTVPNRGFARSGWARSLGWTVVALVLVVIGVVFGAPGAVLIGALPLVIAGGLAMRQLVPGWSRAGRTWSVPARLGLRVTGRAPGRAATLGIVIGSITVVGGLVLVTTSGLAEQAQRRHIAASPAGSLFAYTTRLPSAAAITAMRDALGVERVVHLGIASPPSPPRVPGESPLRSWGWFDVRGPVSDCLRDNGGGDPRDCVERTGFPAEKVPIAVIDPQDLATIIGREPRPTETSALAGGDAVVLDPRLVRDNAVSVVDPDGRVRTFPATVVDGAESHAQLPLVYVSKAGLTALKGVTQPDDSFLYAPAPVTGPISTEGEDSARAALAGDIGPGTFTLAVERGSTLTAIHRSATLAVLLLLILVSATMAFVTVTLATREIRADLSTLAAVGAPRRIRGWINGSHAGVVTALGAVMGMTVTALIAPFLLPTLRVGWTITPWLGLLGGAIVAVFAAVLAGHLAGSKVDTLLRRGN